MSPADSNRRILAARLRILAISPETARHMDYWLAGGWLFRLLLWLCIGFGVVEQASISVWFGPLIAALSAQTVGRAWWWWRRDAVVKAFEDCADGLEALPKTKRGAK